MTLQIVWRGIDPSEALSERIAHHAEELDGSGACRVTVGRPHRHRRLGAPYQVKIELRRPGGIVAVTRDAEEKSGADAYTAVNEAFERLRRMLDAGLRRRRAVLRRAR